MAGENVKQEFYVTEYLSEHIAKTPEGFLCCYDVPVTRTGEFLYKSQEVPVKADESGVVKIQRDEEEVFSDIALASLNGKPVTINHPTEVVSPGNWSKLAVGTVQNARRGEGEQNNLMIADLLITNEKAIELIGAGLREISLGYDAEYVEIEPGLGKQKNLVMNHCALVDKGRAGNICAITDKETCNDDKYNINKKIKEESKMSFKDTMKRFLKFIDGMSEEELEKLEKDQDPDLPKKIQAAKDTYDKWVKDVEEGNLDISKLPTELVDVPIKTTKEEDLTTVDRKTMDEEINNKIKEVQDKFAKDVEEMSGEVKELQSQVSTLATTIKELVDSEEVVKKALDKKVKDEEEKEKEEEKKATEDCATNWSDIASKVELINPGMKIEKPTKDFAKSLRNIKVSALKGALTTDSKEAIESIVKDPDKLTGDALDLAFAGAAELVSMRNNGRVQVISPMITDHKSAVQARDINAKNREFYQKKK